MIYHGDCIEIMNNLISEGIKVDAVICDPPYEAIAEEWDNVISFKEMWDCLYKIVKTPETPIVLFGAQPFTTKLIYSNLENFKYCWYWGKNQATNFFHADRMPLRKIEEICVFNAKTYNPQKTTGHVPTRKAVGCSNGRAYFGTNKRVYEGGDTTRYPNNYLEFKCVDNYHRLHPSQKPVELIEYLIKTHSNEGETVLDFTMGSGTTGVACKNLNRNFIGIEKELKYFEIAEKRINEPLKVEETLSKEQPEKETIKRRLF